MGKKKKKQSPDVILARAEEMFLRGNYLLAKREFEKIAGIAGYGDLAQKIEVCNRKIEEARAEDLVKKARKYAGKGDILAALRCFEEAYAITGESWISDTVSQLQKMSLSQDLSRAARKAEAAGEYLKAAELYGETFASEKEDDLLRKKARCLVKAERYHDAVLLFQKENWEGADVLYDWGLSLAKTGDYYQCLKVWQKIPSRDDRFLTQKQTVEHFLADDICTRFERGDDPGTIYQQGRFLLDTGSEQDFPADMIRSCGFAWFQELWKDEQYERIMEAVDSWPFEMEPALLQICAKAGFKVTEKSGARLDDLGLYWLPAVYAAQAADGRSALKEGARVRDELIRRAEDLLKRYQDQERGFVDTDLVCWNLERRLLEDICGLADGRKKDFHFFICTPRLAIRYGISKTILASIRKKRKRFLDLEQYLNTGAFYSVAGDALYLMEKGEHEKALEVLPGGEAGDEFADWGIARVIFACGIHSMDKGEIPPREFPHMALALLNKAPRFEKILIDGAAKAEELKEQSRYEEVLAAIHTICPRKGLDQALSFVMSRRALEMYNKDHGNDKVLATTLRKALALDPENEHARGLLVDTKVDLECIEIEKALDGRKMSRACRIAKETEHQKVRDIFFEFFEALIDSMDEADLERAEKIVSLNRIYSWCARVDDDHDILYDIEELIEEIEEDK